MIAIDTSSWAAFLAGKPGRDAEAVDDALGKGYAVLPPVVLAELLSSPRLPSPAAAWIRELPLLDVRAGYWERAGRMRARVLRRGLRARLADTLIAQSCIDHGVALVTRDADFRHFAATGALRLL